MGEPTREERDALERLQVEAKALRKQLLEAPPELARAIAEAEVAEKERDAVCAQAQREDKALDQLRDQVKWLAEAASRRGPPNPVRASLGLFVLRLVGIGVGGIVLFCFVVWWLMRRPMP